jgi:nucleotidyltransferase/DNA polymerase involved in DNA repair
MMERRKAAPAPQVSPAKDRFRRHRAVRTSTKVSSLARVRNYILILHSHENKNNGGVCIEPVQGMRTPYDEMMRAGSKLAMEIRADILRKTSFTVSIGVAPNKMLAKIGSQLNKPTSQSVILKRNVEALMRQVPIMKLPKLGIKVRKPITLMHLMLMMLNLFV